MIYKLIDLDNGGYFAGGAIFHSKEEIKKQLISYHHDVEGVKKLTLNDLLEVGNWKIEELDFNEYIENNTLRIDASRRGGGIEIDCSSLFPYSDEPKMTAYQNYLGGGLLGAVNSDSNFESDLTTEKEKALFDELQEALKKYFFNITNEEAAEYDEWNEQSYSQNQTMPKAAY